MTQDWSFCLFTHSHDVHCLARNDLFMSRFLIVDENNYYPSLRPGQSLSIQRLTSPSLSTHCLLISSLSTLSSAASSPLSEWSWPSHRAGVEQCWARSHNPYYLHPFKDLFILCYLTGAAFSVSWSDVGLSFPVSRSCGVWLQGRDVYVRKTIIYVTYKCWDVRFLMLDILALVSCVF